MLLFLEYIATTGRRSVQEEGRKKKEEGKCNKINGFSKKKVRLYHEGCYKSETLRF
jgi:hypothetical protein